MKARDRRVVILAMVWTLGGSLESQASERNEGDLPVVTLGQALPSAALVVARPAFLEQGGSESGRFESAQVSENDRKSLWQALSLARREIRAVSGAAAETEANAGVRLLASNPGQRLTARFLSSAVRIASSRAGRAWQASFSLAGQPAATAIAAKDTRLEYTRGALIEWYENRPEGLEHGVILRERPVGAGEELRLRVAVEGLQPRASGDDPGALDLVDAQGQAVLRYSKLQVWDADGRFLTARLEPGQEGIEILVADAGARYPVTVDPLITSLEAKLGPEVTGSGYEGDNFGYSVGISGDTAVVGAFKDDDKGADSGSVYVFTRLGTNWTQQAKLVPSDGAANDTFGNSVGISGDTVVVGVYQDDDKGSASGSVYVYTRSNVVWSLQSKLVAFDGAASDNFGYAVGISGETAIVGSYQDDDKGSASGSAYVYARSNAVWSLQAKLVAADGAASDYFGRSVDISGDTALVGAHQDDDKGSNSGSAYVFTRSGTNWTQQAKLVPADGASSDNFGYSLGISENSAVVGAYGDDAARGSAYVFTRSETNWTQQAKLTASDAVSSDNFGWSVGISGDAAVVGASLDDDKGSASGSAYVFTRSETNWTQQAKLIAPDGAATDWLGYAVGISGDTVIVGAYQDDDQGTDSGSAYVFALSNTVWSQQSKLTAGAGAANDKFGCSVAISGDSAIIGAYYDDDKGSNSGSAYVFTRAGKTWTPQAKLIASDGATLDYFGYSVAISGDAAVVGAYGDDDMGATSGSAYVFARSNTVWSQQAKLIAADGYSNDNLGSSVGISGDTVIVGAYLLNTTNGMSDAGGAYVFVRSGTNWNQQAQFTASDAASSDNFGFSVALSGDTAVVGAYKNDNTNGTDSGSAYVFTRSNAVWSQQAKLIASDGTNTDYFGWSVAISGDTAVVGANNDDNSGGADAGSAYVFARSGTNWNQQAKLTASDGAAADTFGFSVGISGSKVIVGARTDDDKGDASGSAYVFIGSGAVWSQRAKLLAADGAAADQFGCSVGVSGDTAIIGSWQDDGLDASGALAADQGSAHVFRIKTSRIETIFMVK